MRAAPNREFLRQLFRFKFSRVDVGRQCHRRDEQCCRLLTLLNQRVIQHSREILMRTQS